MADRLIKTTVNLETGDIVWSAADPESTLATVTLITGAVCDKRRERAELHGFVQTCSDPAAGKKTAAEKLAAIAARVAFLAGPGEAWTPERAASVFNAGEVVTALARVKFAGDIDKTNRAIDAVMAKRAERREAVLRLFAADAAVGAEIDRARRAAKPAAANADDLLAEVELAE